MKKINEDIKPTLTQPVSPMSKKYESNFKQTMSKDHIKLNEKDELLNEVDELLSEAEQSLKKKIFSLSKMETLVFSDPKLTAVYNEMSENGEEKYGYHYNETIMNMLFNDYVLNSPKYLQKYKMAIPKEKKRRDKSGINQLKKTGEKTMSAEKAAAKIPQPTVQSVTTEETITNEETGAASSGAFAPALGFKKPVDETTTSASSGAYVGPAAWGSGDLMKKGKSNPMLKKPLWHGGTVIQESNYLTDPQGFEKYINVLNEEMNLGYQEKMADDYHQSHDGSNNGLGVSEIPQTSKRTELKKGIDDNTSLYIGQDVDKMRDDDVKILHNDMTKSNSYFPHKDNPNLPDDGISGKKNVKETSIRNNTISKEDNYIIDKTNAFTSDGIKNWDTGNRNVELNTLKTDTMDKPDLNNMEEAYNRDMYSTKEDLKQLIQSVKQRTGKGLTKEHYPMLAGEALYTVAIILANRMLPISWNELPDINSMWDYIDENGNMSYDKLIAAVKEAVNDRLAEEGYSLDDLMGEGQSESQVQPLNELSLHDTVEYVSDRQGEEPFEMGGIKWQFVNAKYPNGKIDIGVYRFGHDLVYDYSKWREAMNINETDHSMIGDTDQTMANKPQATGTLSGGGVQLGMTDIKENYNIFEELNNELNAYSIHHKKLMKMAEDRKPSALVLRDRVGSENEKNFKKDLQHSGTKEIIDVEKELMYKDQQTEVGKDPQKLGQDLEKTELKATKGTAFENVGDSTNEKGNEIPKRNMTTKEQDEVNLYRKGQHSLVYDNKPSEKFEERMKKDMGDNVYEIRQKQMKDFGKMPMYNKENVYTQLTKVPTTQYNKTKSGWNDPKGVSESMISGRYRDALNKSKIIDFMLNEVKLLKQTSEDTLKEMFKLDFTGLGNSYKGRTHDNKVSVNESVVDALSTHKYYTDGKQVFAIKNPAINLNENEVKEKPVVNEQANKMKHLLGYKPEKYINTSETKKKRGF